MTIGITREIKRGLPFEHLVVVRSRRTHWILRPQEARASLKLDELGGTYPFTATIDNEGILLSLTADETLELPEGDLDFDVLADFTNVTDLVVKRGTMRVTTYDSITPKEGEDSMAYEIAFTQYEDYTRDILVPSVADEEEPMVISDAYLVALNEDDETVFSVVYADPVPNEAAMLAMDADKRGYIGPPEDGFTLTLHISNQAVVPSGAYRYFLYVKDAATSDWDVKLSGPFNVAPGAARPA